MAPRNTRQLSAIDWAAEHHDWQGVLQAADAEYNLGNVLAERGQRDEAIVHLQKAVDIRPDDGNFRRPLQALLAKREPETKRL